MIIFISCIREWRIDRNIDSIVYIGWYKPTNPFNMVSTISSYAIPFHSILCHSHTMQCHEFRRDYCIALKRIPSCNDYIYTLVLLVGAHYMCAHGCTIDLLGIHQNAEWMKRMRSVDGWEKATYYYQQQNENKNTQTTTSLVYVLIAYERRAHTYQMDSMHPNEYTYFIWFCFCWISGILYFIVVGSFL